MKYFRLSFLSVLLIVATYLAVLVEQSEVQRRTDKENWIELSGIEYGLFNVDEWNIVLAELISKKVESFEFSQQNKAALSKEISAFLYQAIDDFEQRYYEKSPKTLGGFLEKAAAKVTNPFAKVRKDVPIFTQQIIDFLDDRKNKQAVKQYLIGQLNNYVDSTFSQTDYRAHDHILASYGYSNREMARKGIKEKIQERDQKNRPYEVALMGIAIIGFLFMLFIPKISRLEILLSVLFSGLFLFMGLSLAMIEIDARIAQMHFNLLGAEIRFDDQVLFYQSKSIVEVVRLMLIKGKADLMVVGILILSFSVLFPISKLLCSVIYTYYKPAQSNAVIRFLVFKTGKWSMADVMVVAIFMAYIGFDGMVGEQLKQLGGIGSQIDVLTTNQSNLLFGFYAFTAFVLLSLAISQRMQKRLEATP